MTGALFAEAASIFVTHKTEGAPPHAHGQRRGRVNGCTLCGPISLQNKSKRGDVVLRADTRKGKGETC